LVINFSSVNINKAFCIHNNLDAFVESATLTANAGNVDIEATEEASITASSTASAITATLSGDTSNAFSGAGAAAFNRILGGARAYGFKSDLTAAGTGKGEVNITTANTSTIDAVVGALAVAVGAGVGDSQGVALGVSIAENEIGWDSSKLGDAERVPIDVKAHLSNSSVDAGSTFDITATNKSTVNAVTKATSVAAALSGGSGVGVSAGGLHVENTMAASVHAYIDSSEKTQAADDITISARDESSIMADARGVSVAAGLGVSTSAGVSVALTLAFNEIDNDIWAYIKTALLLRRKRSRHRSQLVVVAVQRLVSAVVVLVPTMKLEPQSVLT